MSVVFLALLGVWSACAAPAVQYFKQRVDHFDKANAATYQQRYTVQQPAQNGSAQRWAAGTQPTFLFLAGEAPMDDSAMTDGMSAELAAGEPPMDDSAVAGATSVVLSAMATMCQEKK